MIELPTVICIVVEENNITWNEFITPNMNSVVPNLYRKLVHLLKFMTTQITKSNKRLHQPLFDR